MELYCNATTRTGELGLCTTTRSSHEKSEGGRLCFLGDNRVSDRVIFSRNVWRTAGLIKSAVREFLECFAFYRSH